MSLIPPSLRAVGSSKNLIDNIPGSHFLSFIQRYEPYPVQLMGIIGNWQLELVQVVDAYGDLSPLPSKSFMELLLKVNEQLLLIFIKRNSLHSTGGYERPPLHNTNLHMRGFRKFILPGFPGFIVLDEPGDTLNAQQVRSVRGYFNKKFLPAHGFAWCTQPWKEFHRLLVGNIRKLSQHRVLYSNASHKLPPGLKFCQRQNGLDVLIGYCPKVFFNSVFPACIFLTQLPSRLAAIVIRLLRNNLYFLLFFLLMENLSVSAIQPPPHISFEF